MRIPNLIYQIYPLGLCEAPYENDNILVNRMKNIYSFLPHIKNLGTDYILFNPLFDSDKHGYDTRDFLKTDPRLGTNEQLADLIEAIHKQGMYVLFDGVFNHVGRGFWAFRDVLSNKHSSRYKDWFHINFDSDSCFHDGFWYKGWEGHYELVELNLHNKEVRDYLLSVVDTWFDIFHIDGLRLDVAYTLNHDFLYELRCNFKSKHSDAFLFGEVLFGDYNLIVNDRLLPSCTNYECYKGIHSSINSQNLFEITYSLFRQFGYENWCLYKDKLLVSFIDNHDVTRIASLVNEKSLRQAYGILFGMPGIPCIYYGSEWGEKGLKSDGDNALRKSYSAPTWNALTEYITRLAAIRKDSNALRYGSYRNILTQNKYCVFERRFEKEIILVAINIDDSDKMISLHLDNNEVVELITQKVLASGDEILLPANSTQYFRMLDK